jgi:glycosyltransferase involved in cell wall biosynthesis
LGKARDAMKSCSSLRCEKAERHDHPEALRNSRLPADGPNVFLNPRGRLGIYLDADYRVVTKPDGKHVAVHPADYAFVGLFLREVGTHFDSLVLLGRAFHASEFGEYVQLPQDVDLIELPYYADLTQLRSFAAASPGTIRRMWTALAGVDTVWTFGPHPFSVLIAVLARLRGKSAVLGVRQDSLAYFRARLPSRRWAPAMIPIHALDASYRLLARGLKTVVVGDAIAARYGGEDAKLLRLTSDSVVPSQEIDATPPTRDWNGTLDLLTVARIDPEKNPLLLVEALAELEQQQPGRHRLVWVGDGPLAGRVRARAEVLGVAESLRLLGWVPFGPDLLGLYRGAHVFVHVSLTEGMPRVLTEALAFALPVVATDVGGVRSALDGGRAGLLVPPNDKLALVDAIQTIAADAELREELVTRGLELARERTLEAQAELVAKFIGAPK